MPLTAAHDSHGLGGEGHMRTGSNRISTGLRDRGVYSNCGEQGGEELIGRTVRNIASRGRLRVGGAIKFDRSRKVGLP